MIYLAIDPGETTGYVTVEVSHGIMLFIAELGGTWHGPEELLKLVYPPPKKPSPILIPKHVAPQSHQPAAGQLSFVRTPLFQKPNVVITEDYRIYPHAAKAHIGSRVYTAKVIGRIELLVAMTNSYRITHTPPLPSLSLVYQMASRAKQQWPNRRIFKHFSQAPVRKLNKHVLDALRHLLTYLENNNIRQFFKTEDAI